MPMKAPHICGCGKVVPGNQLCACQLKRMQERKARFDAKRPTARQRGYTARWEHESKAYLAANPKCRRCPKPATLVNHIQPHKGNQALFWNKANWEPACTSCHSGPIQAEERKRGHA